MGTNVVVTIIAVSLITYAIITRICECLENIKKENKIKGEENE